MLASASFCLGAMSQRPLRSRGSVAIHLVRSREALTAVVNYVPANTTCFVLPEPGKRTLILGLNGFGNIAGVIGAQIYGAQYGPSYRISFDITLGFVVAAFLGYASYRFTLAAVNRRRQAKLAQMGPDAIEHEQRDSTRYADRKYTFIYGL